MKPLSLRGRLLLWSGTASALTLALVIGLVDRAFSSNIREELEIGLQFARQVAEGTRANQMDARISQTVAMAVESRLRAAVATADPLTISQSLAELHTPGTRGWAAVLSPEGEVIAATEETPHTALTGADALLAEAAYYDTGDLWLVDDEIVEVAASPILFGAEHLAILVTGEPLDAGRATALEAAVGRPVAIVAGGSMLLGERASSLPRDGRAALTTWSGPEGEVVLSVLGEERFFTTGAPLLTNGGDELGTAVLLASYDEALAPSNALRTRLIIVFFAGLVVTALMGRVFSRGITVPVGRLLDETEHLARGNLERPIEPLRNDEIGRLADSFEHMRVSLKAARDELIRGERLRAIGRAASAVAHDFTQPLSTIAGAIGLLRMDGDTPEVRERCFTAIEGQIDRLQRMKQEIVEFARGEATLDDAEVRIDSFLENTLTGLRARLEEQGIALEVDHGYTGEWTIDSYRLGRVIENLVRNAASAIGRDGSIQVRSRQVGRELQLSVSDDGPGIPEDKLDEIFEPFVSFGKKEGTGLGLAIARNVVAQHDGTIDGTSEVGAGTIFTISLPRRGDESRTDAGTEDAPRRQMVPA